ncbi:MAG: hypothetical protein RBQ65_09065, partial [Sphaerochaeta sp.]|nr:hypothetical protein [Sphaerochaeta sp.]
GQEYGQLAHHCDWIKAMTYTKAIGPAGLPLEAGSLVDGLREADSGLTYELAASFVQGLLGLGDGSVEALPAGKGFPPAVLTDEVMRAKVLAGSGVEVLSGIELVNHPVFPTSISEIEARQMIEAVQETHTGLVTCWNLLYIPEKNYRHLAVNQGVNRG